MSAPTLSNVSPDLIWEIVRNNNSFLAKTKKIGGVQFSRDPFNLTNKSSRKHAGFVNPKAVAVSEGEKGAIVVKSKKTSSPTKPAAAVSETTFGGNKSSRKTYLAVANQSAKSGYRPDLRSAAVERVSAIKRSQKPVKPDHEIKLRGNAAKKAAQKAAAAEEN
ncbi:hypothetical protein G7046_g9727 [Stylonectria norvegica]|nr:hypothetical protein G7046_g9727 [Stylonectria norvegica]